MYEAGWGVSLTEHYQKRYHDTQSNVSAVPRYVAAYDTVDGQLFYKGLKSFQFTVRVKTSSIGYRLMRTTPPR